MQRVSSQPRVLLLLLLPALLAGALIAAPGAQAAEVAAGYATYLSTLNDQEPVSAILVMRDQADIESLNHALRVARATRGERHERVLSALQAQSVTQADLAGLLADRQATGEVLGYTRYWIANLIVVQATKAFLLELAARDDIGWIEPNFSVSLIEPVEVAGSPDEPERVGVTPGLRAINADRVWYELGITGAGRLGADLDTGVDGNHPALSSRWRGRSHPWQECWLDVLGTGTTFPTDTHGHGTHVMGTIAGLGAATRDSVGIAWGAQWIACNAINQNVGSGFDNDIITALQWFADPDGNPNTVDDVPDVVQNSWRINEGFGYGYTDCDSRWWAAIDNCEASGVVTTWSAGNEGPGSRTIGSPADRITSPTNAFSVGAVDATNYPYPYPIAGFSSRGPSGCDGVTIKPEVCAPGVDVYSSVAGGGYTYMSGTSMSGPHVAGVVVLMREANPDLDVQTIKEILMETAIDFGSAGEENTYGRGFIDAYEAVLAVMSGYGTLAGAITNASNGGTPVQGATVDLVEADRQVTSHADGTYSISAPAGTYTVSVTHPSFAPQTAHGVEILDGELTVRNFALTDVAAPAIGNTTEYRSTEDTVGPYVIETDVTDYSALDHVRLYYRLNGGSFMPLAMTPVSGHYRAAIPGQPHTTFVQYYVEAADVVMNTAVDPPMAPMELYGFYVAPIVELFTDGMEAGGGGWTHSYVLPGFTDQWHLSTQRNHTAGGAQSWKCGAAGAGTYANLLDAGLLSPPVELGIDSYLHYWQWVDAETSAAYSGRAYDGGLVEISVDGGAWTQIMPDGGYTFRVRTGSTPGPFPADTPIFSGRRNWHEVHFNLGTYEGTAQLRWRFGSDGATAREGWYVDDVVVDGFQIDYSFAGDLPGRAPVWLLSTGPNPALHATGLRYRLAAPAEVRLQVLDATGRVIRTLVAGSQAAGLYDILWDGRDDGARLAPAGIYLSRLRAGGVQATEKIVLAR